MTTQFTPILQLALPVTGELNGTWGDVVNDNITSMVEEAIAGLATISTWTTNAHTLTTADGVTDEARCAMLVAQTGAGGTALTGAGEIICPALTKLFVLSNASAYAVTLKTASGTGISVPAGDTAFLFCDGTNVNPCVTTIVNGHISGNLTVDGNTTLGNSTSDTITANARVASDLNPSADNTYDLGTSGNSWRNLYIDGTATIATLNVTTIDTTNLEVTNIKAKDGTAAITIADATGAVTVSSAFAANGNSTLGDASSDTLTINATATANAPVVISTNSSSDALRITQTGAGNALLVEDSANPDATPFVVNAAGLVLVGNTTSVNTPNYGGTQFGFQLQGQSAVAYDGISLQNYVNGSGAANLTFAHSRSGGLGTHSVLSDGDRLGALVFAGSDGTAFIQAANIQSYVDGTPGTNDMPGRLVFSTTADGASSPTERMRIDNAGRVGIGGTPVAGTTLKVVKTITGATQFYNVSSEGSVQSDVTGTVRLFSASATTAASAFTLSQMRHFDADQGTFGVGSTVNNQYGFYANSTLTGATNNYGFYSAIAAGTGRYNFYANGTADNYFAGSVGVGSTNLTGFSFRVSKSMTGASTTYGLYNSGAIQSDSTSTAYYFITNCSTSSNSGTPYTVANIIHYSAGQGTFNADSTVTSQYGYYLSSSLTGATNNYGFHSNIAAGTGRWNFYANGTADNYMAGPLAIGGTTTPTAASQLLRVGSNMSAASGADAAAVVANPSIQTSVTGIAKMFQAAPESTASVFSINSVYNYYAAQNLNANTTVTNFYGFIADATLTKATNNYGFFSNIAAGTGRWNFYANGTASNYFAGNTGVGGVPFAGSALRISPALQTSTEAVSVYVTGAYSSATTAAGISFYSQPDTAASAFTMNSLRHFYAVQGTIGAGSTVTNQYGFQVYSNLTGATNNYGFYSSIASGTGRYNFYAAGTADNVFMGKVGIGSTTIQAAIDIRTNLTTAYGGGTNASGVYVSSAFTDAALVDGIGFTTFINPGSGVNLTTLKHFTAQQRAFVGTATYQYGFNADANLTGATNNYGFHSNIASGTGRYNFYAAGTADNYFAGDVLVGTATSKTTVFSASGNGITIGDSSAPNIALWDTSDASYVSYFGQVNADSYLVNSSSTGVMILGTNATERMRIDSAGRIGIGSTSITNYNLKVFKPLTGSTTSFSISTEGIVQSDVTSNAIYYSTEAITAAASFTLSNLHHYRATQGTIGVGSAVTNQFGFRVESTLTGATNNYGFYSNIASGTGRWNFYAAGAAANYFAGAVGVGNTPSIGTLEVSAGGNSTPLVMENRGSTVASFVLRNSTVTGTQTYIQATGADLAFAVGATERMRIDSSGNVIQTAPTTAPTLSTNGTMVFNLTSNTNLRVSVRGSDGVTRTANITLA